MPALWQISAMRSLLVAAALLVAPITAFAESAPHEFLDDAKALLVIGACADGTPPEKVKAELVAKHCEKVKAAQEDYKKSWL